MPEKKPPHKSWESYADELIREAQEAGEFDNLPGFGQPIPGMDGPDDELWWIKEKLRRERLSLLPPSLQILADVDKALADIWTLTHEAAVRRALVDINERIRQANFAAISGPPSTLLPLEVEKIVAEWRKRRG